jgi:3-oxoadipate enol-lactonase
MPRLQTRDIVINHEEQGRGDALLLIGDLGADLRAWGLTVPALARHFRVITFDNRGAGLTSAPDSPYTIDQMADDAVGVLEGLDIAKAHVAGFGMGGLIAQEMALRAPTRVDRLVLLATTPAVDGYSRAFYSALATVRRTNISREGFVRLMAPLLYSKEFLADTARVDRAVQSAAASAIAQQDHAYIRQVQAILRFDASPRLKDTKAQTLVLHGDEDILVPPHNAEALQSGIPGAKLTMLPGGHAGVLEHADAYNAAILDFLGVTAAAAAS